MQVHTITCSHTNILTLSNQHLNKEVLLRSLVSYHIISFNTNVMIFTILECNLCKGKFNNFQINKSIENKI